MKLTNLDVNEFKSHQKFLDDFGALCGMPHPRLDGNNCELTEGHKPETHLDAAGNEWIGRITE